MRFFGPSVCIIWSNTYLGILLCFLLFCFLTNIYGFKALSLWYFVTAAPGNQTISNVEEKW